MSPYDKITRDLFEKARAETGRRLEEIRARAPAEHGPLIRYVHENVYDAGLTLQKARAATGIRAPGLCAALGGGKSFAAYLAAARIATAERMAAARQVPLGCVMNAVGIGSYTSFLRQWVEHSGTELVLFEAPRRLAPAFDVVSWHHAVHATLAPRAGALAGILLAACPSAFASPVEPRDILEGTAPKPGGRHDVLRDFRAASRRPLRVIAWAAATAGVEYGKLFRHLGKQAFDPERGSGKPLTLEAAKAAVFLRDSSPSSKLAFLVGESWKPFLEKRLVEATLGLLAHHPVSDVAAVLCLPERKLDAMVLRRTGVSAFDLEATVRRTAGHPAFRPWMEVGQGGPETLSEEECRLLAGLLEAAAEGCCRRPATAPLLAAGGAPAARQPGENWALLAVLAAALDDASRDPGTHETFRRGLLQSPLREDVVALEWHAARLEGAHTGVGSGPRPGARCQTALEGWRTAEEHLSAAAAGGALPVRDLGAVRAVAWTVIARWRAAAPQDRHDLTALLAKVTGPLPVEPPGYDAGLRSVAVAYEAMELLRAQSLDPAVRKILSAPILHGGDVGEARLRHAPGADRWTVIETLNVLARISECIDHEVAVRHNAAALDLARAAGLWDQLAATVLTRSKLVSGYGVACLDELKAVLDHSRDSLPANVLNLVRYSYAGNQIYFAASVDAAGLRAEIEELVAAFHRAGDALNRSWARLALGLLLLRLGRFRDSVSVVSTARDELREQGELLPTHWADAFLAVACFGAGELGAAEDSSRVAAAFFCSDSSHCGPVREAALAIVRSARPSLHLARMLGQALLAPHAPAGNEARFQVWGEALRRLEARGPSPA